MKSKSQSHTIYEYTTIFERNERGGYTVTVPAFPGLITEGNDLEDAKTMAEDAIRCYIEGARKAKEKIPREHEVAQVRVSVTV